ncbi:MAG: prevent-host-death protein [Syntrophus sp. (in: bacteria)]|nr:prevent-host-death protein [Syntrophus sp. (in: bacteria)]
MKVYTYSEAREKLSSLLEESKTEEVVIKRRRGDMYAIVPQYARPHRSPFDVPGLGKSISRQEILEAIAESRERTGSHH